MSAHLHIPHPEPGGTTFDLHDENISIGRDSENSVQIDHPSVSGHYAELVQFDGRFRLTDRASTNGSWVNDLRVSSQELNDGDKIRFGDVLATFLQGAAGNVGEPANLGIERNSPVMGGADADPSEPSATPPPWFMRRSTWIVALCLTLMLISAFAIDRSKSVVKTGTPAKPVLEDNHTTPTPASNIPPSWLGQSSDARRLIKTAKRMFDVSGTDTDALRIAIAKVPGLATKEPPTAAHQAHDGVVHGFYLRIS